MKRVRGNRLYDIAKRPVPAPEPPIEAREVATETPELPESPPNEVYLDSDVDNGRPRVIIMLTEDGERIENLFLTKMSYVQAVSNLAVVTHMHTQRLLTYLLSLERQQGTLLAEIEFLRDKLANSQPPPRDAVQPQPKMPTAEGEVA